MLWLELGKAGIYGAIGAFLSFLLAPPIQEMNYKRETCRAFVEAENDAISLVENGDRVSDRPNQLDAKTRVVTAKAAALQVSIELSSIPSGPGPRSIKEFLNLVTAEKAYWPKDLASVSKYRQKTAAVSAACERHYSAWDSIPRELFNWW